jgi:DNA-binding response OmpR family regulator
VLDDLNQSLALIAGFVELGVDMVLTKPFTASQLRVAVASLVNHK